jgi:hypothetical protein
VVGLLGACFGATSAWFQSALRGVGVTLVEFDWAGGVDRARGVDSEHGRGAVSGARGVAGYAAPVSRVSPV